MLRAWLLVALSTLASCVAGASPSRGGARPPDPRGPAHALPAAARARPRMHFLKGQLHAHTGNSGDSRTAVEVAIEYYERWGYDFVFFTDHNFVTERPPEARTTMLVLAGVELTQNPLHCEPPQDPGVKDCLMHVNALFAEAPVGGEIPWPPKTPSLRVIDFYARALEAGRELGGLLQLNHPNFHWTASDPALVAELVRRGVALMEVANEGMPLSNPGDERHLSTEALWDAVLSQGLVVWGTATDDTHHYDDLEERLADNPKNAYPGNRGWVMVHAEPDPASIRAALEAGDFWFTNGVELDRVEVTGGGLEIDAPAPVEVRFIGKGGKELARQRGRRARFEVGDAPGYVRAVIVDGAGRKAWTQPVFSGVD